MKTKQFGLWTVLSMAMVTSLAQAKQSDSQGWGADRDAKGEITEQVARTIALNVVPGVVKEVEHEKHKGIPVYSVEIVAQDGRHEVLVNAITKEVLENKLQGEHEENEGGDDDD